MLLSRLIVFLRSLLRRPEFERDLDEELRAHQALREEHLLEMGVPQKQAVRQARVEFGSLDARKEECREAFGLGPLTGLWGDVLYACRGVKNRPGFAIVAILTMAVAIGANTAMFTFLNAYLLRPFPVADPARNVRLTPVWAHGFGETWSYPDYRELRAPNAMFQNVYASSYGRLLTLRDPAPRTVLVSLVSGNLFQTMSARTILGRPITPADDEAVVVLSHSAWVRLFGGDPGILGKTIRLHQATCTIVGVAAPGFTGIELLAPDFWAPLSMTDRIAPPTISLASRERSWLYVGGVLKPGVTAAQAQDSLSALIPTMNVSRRPDSALSRIVAQRWDTVFLIDAHTQQAIVLCFAVFGLLLLVACANLASLMLAGAFARHREMAIRMSIGASRVRLLRQVLTESVLLASLGAGLGLVLTSVTASVVQHYLFGFLTRLGLSFEIVGPDWRAWAFGAALAVAAGVLFGAAPALIASRSSLAASVQRDSVSGAGVRPHRLRNTLIVLEVTASLVLLVAAGLFYRLSQRIAGLDHGYDVSRIVDVRLDGPKSALIQQLQNDDNVEAIAEVNRAPLSGSLPQLPAVVGGQAISLGYNYVDHGYFATLGIPLRRGRTFTRDEALGQAPVAVVSEATARRLWPGSDPLGQRLEVKAGSAPGRFAPGSYHVIGVVRDVVNGRLDEGTDWSSVYFPAAPGDRRDRALLIRVRRDAPALVDRLREECFLLGPTSSCSPVLLTDAEWLQRFPYLIVRDLSCGVGIVALTLVSIGLYGVVAFAVIQRKREIGIRMALGARPWSIVGALIAESSRLVLYGVGIALPLCIAAAYAASFNAHGADLPLFDPIAYAATTAFLIAVSLFATWAPSRSAATIDPAIVLRQD